MRYLKVIKAETTEKGTTISFIKYEKISINTMVSITTGDENNSKDYNFKVSKVIASDDNNYLYVEATEVGYYANKTSNNDFDPMSILGLDVSIITDENKIKRIEQQSRWC